MRKAFEAATGIGLPHMSRPRGHDREHRLRGKMTKLWIQSDQHFEIYGTPQEFAVPQADIVANPQGYAGENEGFDPGVIIEL